MIKVKDLMWVGLGALFFSIMGVVVAYVAMYTVLNIKETNNVWFVEIANVTEEGTGLAKSTLPEVNATSITNLNVNLYQKNDQIKYKFRVINRGGVDARLGVIGKARPLCVQNDEVVNDACSKVSYELLYSDGRKVTTGDLLAKNTNVEMQLVIKYDGEQDVNLSLSEMDLLLIYEQD